MQAVAQYIEKEVKRTDSNLATDISQYIIHGGGKRIRPLVVLLTAGACGGIRPQHIALASAIEFIHTATILHDDVVDGSERRRNRPTANHEWGNAASVLTGDLLYSRAVSLLISLEVPPVIDIVVRSCEDLASGELMQLSQRRRIDTSEELYLEIIRCKTAVLFEAAVQCSALLCDANQYVEAVRLYGLHSGIAFQLADDILDYTGDAQLMGKDPGTDLSEGKITMPLIHAFRSATAEQQAYLQRSVTQDDAANLSEVTKLLHACGSIEYAQQYIRAQEHKATTALATLPPSKFTEAMKALLTMVAERRQ